MRNYIAALTIATSMFFSTNQAFAGDFCARTKAVRQAIEEMLNKPCDQITALDLSDFTGTLDLSSKYIFSLEPNDFEGFASLEVLRLNDNYISDLPEGIFQGLTSVKEISVVGNRIKTLPERIFQGLRSLEILNLLNNQITSLPEGIFQGLATLQLIEFDFNDLSVLPDWIFQGIPSLNWVSLSHNNLKDISEIVFNPAGFSANAMVNISDNPLSQSTIDLLNQQLPNRIILEPMF